MYVQPLMASVRQTHTLLLSKNNIQKKRILLKIYTYNRTFILELRVWFGPGCFSAKKLKTIVWILAVAAANTVLRGSSLLDKQMMNANN